MQPNNLLEEIRRLKKNVRQVDKRSKQKQQLSTLQKALSTADKLKTTSNLLLCQTGCKQKSSQSLTNSSDCLSSKQIISQSDQSSLMPYIFAGQTFYFPLRDLELTNKRVQIFSKIIKNRGGCVVSPEQNFQKKIDYLLCSKSTCKDALQKVLHQQDKQQIKSSMIINYQYIIDCQKSGINLSVQSYQLFSATKSTKIEEKMNESRKIRQIIEQPTDDQYFQQRISSTVCRNDSFKKIAKSVQKQYQINKQKFACQSGSSQSQFPINQYIYEQLMKFYNIYQSQKDTGRKIAYLKAASAIKSYHKQIESQKDIMKLRGIGKKIIQKIKELLETGQIQKLESLRQKQQTIVCQQLTRVWGVGASKARQLYAKGIKSLQKLKESQDLLNKNQKIGLKYVQQFEKRIPREKVMRIFQFVRGRIWQMAGRQDLHQIQVCGSFRRGKQTCGDIDIIISRKDGIYQQNFVIDLINKLQKQGFLTDHLNIPSKKQFEPSKSTSYMGVCIFEEKIHHRIDIKYYQIQQFAFATLYFTGSDMFNRSMRLFARKKGYSLSDQGLSIVQRNGKNEKIWKSSQIKLFSQKQIFEFLGLDYKNPKERNI